jgi:hypothetical protein
MITGVSLKNKSEEECTNAILEIKGDHQVNGQTTKQIIFDREPGIVPARNSLNANGIELILKAAGQKVGLAEVSIRLVREKARATKARVRARFGYLPPNQLNMDLCMDSISVLNRIPKQGQSVTPYQVFTDKKPDYVWDMRAEWGEPIVVKKPKGVSSDLTVTGQWAIIVRRIMNGTGVLKVYLIQSKRYAYRLKFVRAKAPEWVLEALKDINPEANISFKDGEETQSNHNLHDLIDQIEAQDVTVVEDDEAVEIDDPIDGIGDKDKQTTVMQSIKSVKEAWDDNDYYPVKVEKIEDESTMQVEAQLEQIEPQSSGQYITRYGQVSRPPNRLIETAYVILKEMSDNNCNHDPDGYAKQTIECTYAMKALLFQKAMQEKPEEAMKALREEVLKAVTIGIWEPIHVKSLADEQQKMIIPRPW